MTLKYKISASIMFVSLFIVGLVSVIYSENSYNRVIENEQHDLLKSSVESARYIEKDLLGLLAITKTMGSSYLVSESLQSSNLEYEKFSDNEKITHIAELNRKWMSAKSDNDGFVKSYMNNKLALYLKKQQAILPKTYGEIFITNRYGAMIATTGKLTTLAHAKKYWWKEAYSSGDGKTFFDDRGFDKSVKGYVIGIVIPIKNDGEVIGVLKANINIIGTLNEVVDRYKKIGHGSLMIVRTKGLVVYESGSEVLSTKVNPIVLDKLKDNATGVIITENMQKNVLISFSPVRLTIDNDKIKFGGKSSAIDHKMGNEGELWHTVINHDKSEAMIDSEQINGLIIYLGIGIAFFSTIIAYLIGIFVSRPIDKLIETQEKLREHEKIMMSQSRHAAMGEMVSMIAHQWRQPLSVISMGANNMLADVELDNIQPEEVKKFATNILNQATGLSAKIEVFSGLFNSKTEKELMFVSDVIEDSLRVIDASLNSKNISVQKDYNSNSSLTNHSVELLQVLLNIFKNSAEALMVKNIAEPSILIKTIENEDNVSISICDNGNGIPEDIIEDIFDPYFSTKSEKNESGLGLYMTKIIVVKHLNGTIEAKNREEGGACFTLTVPKEGKSNE